ncbi:hypothetical protein K458DRAFT_448786 [Lentithecium fluviatile CBS 122367]|uniref:Killer toxin Kp4 domain-containing protein n=1 Tax=Lentithecium fluviatile CBS 122367 TaxID=1168545 RepID=A0A6G1JPD7_9PLEO|nr:hypothetical protein K458DRAFT_448786 [Lentithecium fluviatile CBS 122367]
MFAKMLTFVLLWAVALAMPSDNTAYTPNHEGLANRAALDNRGINCKGSSLCNGCNHLAQLRDLVNTISDDLRINDGQLIACSDCYAFFAKCSGICVFLQHMHGQTLAGRDVKALMGRLADQGCKGCGSVSVWENERDMSKGELTSNFVYHGCCGPRVRWKDGHAGGAEVPVAAQYWVDGETLEYGEDLSG